MIVDKSVDRLWLFWHHNESVKDKMDHTLSSRLPPARISSRNARHHHQHHLIAINDIFVWRNDHIE